jgi:hypothetical protein
LFPALLCNVVYCGCFLPAGEQSRDFCVVLATNRPSDLDPAVIDRTDEALEFGLPEEAERWVGAVFGCGWSLCGKKKKKGRSRCQGRLNAWGGWGAARGKITAEGD